MSGKPRRYREARGEARDEDVGVAGVGVFVRLFCAVRVCGGLLRGYLREIGVSMARWRSVDGQGGNGRVRGEAEGGETLAVVAAAVGGGRHGRGGLRTRYASGTSQNADTGTG